MSVVLKWPLHLVDEVQMIGTGPVALVAMQHDRVTVWTIEASDLQPISTTRRVRIFGTNHVVPDDYEHLGSVCMPPFVWHVFEEVLL